MPDLSPHHHDLFIDAKSPFDVEIKLDDIDVKGVRSLSLNMDPHGHPILTLKILPRKIWVKTPAEVELIESLSVEPAHEQPKPKQLWPIAEWFSCVFLGKEPCSFWRSLELCQE